MKDPYEHLVLHWKCMPTEPPLLWSLVAFMVTDFYDLSNGTLFALSCFIGAKWLFFLAGAVLDKPYDIFESFRKNGPPE